jgi:hypothetical protein
MNTMVSDSRVEVRPSTRRRSLGIGAAIMAVAIAAVLWAVLKSGSRADSSQLSSLPYVAAAAFGVGAAVFAWLVPARIAARGTGLIFAIVSVPFLAAYWSALSMIIGAGAVLVGLGYREGAGPKRGRALAAIIIGSLVCVATVGGVLVG